MSEVIDAPVKAKKDAVKQYKVTIHSGEDKADKGDVFLSHNFKSLLIQRDQEVTIGEHFLEVLKHSTIETTVKDDKGNERAIKVPRFSYSVQPA
jgi:hypothetical protein